MESEKVKEIKKALECCSTLMDNNATSEEQDNSCNECPYRLNDRCSWKLDSDALTLINELEKGNAIKTDTIVDLLKKQEFYETEKLKQFAERLKEMAYKSTDWSHGEHPLVVEVDYIDEVLEEFLGK
jgi:hypothetical protein